MERIPFRFVAVGGSISTGYAADVPSSQGWAALVARRLEARFPNGVAFLNRGVSGTDSAAGALRIREHAEGADLVILEFAVNDQWLDPTIRRQTYEGCLRQILSLASRPRVLCLFLSEQGNAQKGQASEQRVLADYYGVASLDFGAWYQHRVDRGLARWEDAWSGDPIHPNNQGHRAIADAVNEALHAVLSQPPAAPAAIRDLRVPLYTSDWQFTRFDDTESATMVRHDGWQPGSDVHGEWAAHGGAPRGWHTERQDAVLELAVRGKVIGVLYSESEHYTNLLASVDGGPPVVLETHVPFRQGYLGWAYRVVARGLTDGEHRLVISVAPGSTGIAPRAHVLAAVAAGVTDSGRVFDAVPPSTTASAPGTLPLVWTGRFDPQRLPQATFGWQLSQLSGRFTGPKLTLHFGDVRERNYFRLSVDGRARFLEVLESSPRSVTVADDLGAGEHRFELVKRSEGYFGSATLVGLELAPGEQWLEAPERPARRLEFYGDSITAGACNEDAAVDQYDTLAPHDPDLSYGAIAARRLGAEVVGIAVSGTGLTCSWNPILMPEVWHRTAPDLAAPEAANDRAPDVVVVNLGQNDYGFPQSQGLPLDPAYAARLVALVRALRQRYPSTWIVGALGGMTGWKESETLRRLWAEAWAELRSTDSRVRSFFFRASSEAHPRVDVHALLAEELTEFLAREVWPHLETPLH